MKGKEVVISKNDQGIYKITISPKTNATEFTTVKSVISQKADIISDADKKWNDSIMNEIYATNTQNKMFELRRKDGPKFKAYRLALAAMMATPNDVNLIEPTKKVLIALIAEAPKSLAPLTAMITKAVENGTENPKKLATILTKIYDLTLGSRLSHTIGEEAKHPQKLEKAGKEYAAYAAKLAPQFAKVWTEK